MGPELGMSDSEEESSEDESTANDGDEGKDVGSHGTSPSN